MKYNHSNKTASYGIVQYRGFHDSTRDFPVVNKQKLSYPTECSQDIVINFKSIVFQLPANVLLYICDYRSIGLEKGWVPPKNLISNLQNTSKFTFDPNLYPRNMKNVVACGYLSRNAMGQVIDTKGGDANIANAELVNFDQTLSPKQLKLLKERLDINAIQVLEDKNDLSDRISLKLQR